MKQNLIQILREANRMDQIDPLYRDLLATTREGPGNDHFNIVLGYAQYLSETKRFAESEALVNEYRASHSNLQPYQETGLLYALANSARGSGDAQRAEELQKQAALQSPSPKQQENFIGPLLSKAQSAAFSGRTDEALGLASEAIEKSATAPDGNQIAWQGPSIASALVQRKAYNEAQQIINGIIAVAQTRAVDSQQALTAATQGLIRALLNQKDRWPEIPPLLERYRSLQIEAHGAETSAVKDVVQMTLQFEQTRNSPGAALRAAEEMVDIESSLTGRTSEAYLAALFTLAGCQDRNGGFETALSTHQRRIEIADSAFSIRDEIRGRVRSEAAQFLANHGKFDDAERLLDQALQLSKNWQHPNASFFTQQRERIRRMRIH
jgi:hypothetical protein